MLVHDHEADGTIERSRPARPPPCPKCKAESWWNGWRLANAVAKTALDEVCRRIGCWLSRAKCASCRHGFTLYPADFYPHRQFQIDVVADVTAAIALGAEVPAQAAKRAMASATSARRWTAWVSGLASPAVLLSVAQRLAPDVSVGIGVAAFDASSPVRARAGQVLAALEELGAALVRRGVELVSRTGLGRVLEWQRRAHGDVVYLTTEPNRLSPPMELGPSRCST